MNLDELIEKLEAQFGNEYAPKQYFIVQEAIKQLRLLKDDNETMREQIAELVVNRLEDRV